MSLHCVSPVAPRLKYNQLCSTFIQYYTGDKCKDKENLNKIIYSHIYMPHISATSLVYMVFEF